MNRLVPMLLAGVLTTPAAAQVAGKFPPDSLVNVRVIPRTIPVIQVIGQMRNITSYLGVRCPYCHVGTEGQDLSTFDFASDDKRTKRAAREMMRMVQAINNDYLPRVPERPQPPLDITCETCHRGVPRPMPLYALLLDVATNSGADSAVQAYRNLRERYYGRSSYDFGEGSLNVAAFRLGRAGKFDEAFALLRLNEEQFPAASSPMVFRGNINLMRRDTAAAVTAFQGALQKNAQDFEARQRLRDLGRTP